MNDNIGNIMRTGDKKSGIYINNQRLLSRSFHSVVGRTFLVTGVEAWVAADSNIVLHRIDLSDTSCGIHRTIKEARKEASFGVVGNLIEGYGTVRGGSWLNTQWGARCASQGRRIPDSSNYSIGFRVIHNVTHNREYPRVARGGSWNNVQWSARCASRYRLIPDLFYYHIGFRVAHDVTHNQECPRVARGGSWNYDQWYARCASRRRLIPDYFHRYLGFRVTHNVTHNRECPRVVRGGSWYDAQGLARCAFRLRYIPVPFYSHIGFRVTRGLELQHAAHGTILLLGTLRYV